MKVCAYCNKENHEFWCPSHRDNHERNCTQGPDGRIYHQSGCIHQKEETMNGTDGQYDEVKDSGERREFSTGSVRDVRGGKGRFDLIPSYSLRRLAKHYENGAIKYGDRNWEKGQPLASYVDSMLRHGQDYLEGDRSEDHMAAVAWNAFAIMFTEEMIRQGKLSKEFANMPPRIVELPDHKEQE